MEQKDSRKHHDVYIADLQTLKDGDLDRHINSLKHDCAHGPSISRKILSPLLVIATAEKNSRSESKGVLEVVGRRIERLKAWRDTLKDYKKGVMQQIFSQQIRFTKPDRSPFPNWQEKRLGDIATMGRGKGLSKADITADGKTPCIRYAELYTTYGTVIDEVVSYTNVDKSELLLSKGGEIIIPSSGETAEDIATASVVKQSGVALGGDLNVLASSEVSTFLAYYISSKLRRRLSAISQGNSIVHLYGYQIETSVVKIPHLDEQKKIADFLSAIDRRIDFKTSQIFATEVYKKAFTQRMSK